MRKYLLLLLALLSSAFGIKAYDFVHDGVYYKILSPWKRTVAVACGNTRQVEATKVRHAPQQTMTHWDYLTWEGNSYSGDVVIPKTVTGDNNGIIYTVTEIDMGAFCYCSELKSVTLPSTLERVCVGAFASCTGLQEVILPDGITVVEDEAFFDCTALRHVHFPTGSTVVNLMTFYGAGAPEGFQVTGTENVETIYFNTFTHSTLKEMPRCPNLKYAEFNAFAYTLIEEAEIPEGCLIGNNLFGNCERLRRVTAPKGLANPWDLFYNNGNMELLRYHEPTPPEVTDVLFLNTVGAQCVLEVPEESVEAYRKAPIWQDFYEIRAITPTGVTTAEIRTPKVKTERGAIEVTGADSVSIHNPAGQTIFSGTSARVNLPYGIYIVKADSSITKVTVP